LTIKDYIKKLETKQKDLQSLSEKALFNASLATKDAMSKRIFDDGQNVSGRTFQYSKKPAIISGYKIPKSKAKNSKVYRFQAFKQLSKNGKKGYFGRFFANGYYEYKKFIGRNNSFVNFKLTGGLQMAFNNGLKKISKDEYQLKLTNERATELRGYLDEKYGSVFKISANERIYFKEIYQKEILLNFTK
jgi:hypothetical protein